MGIHIWDEAAVTAFRSVLGFVLISSIIAAGVCRQEALLGIHEQKKFESFEQINWIRETN